MEIKRSSGSVVRSLVVNEEQQVTKYRCYLISFDGKTLKYPVEWVGPDREMREMMKHHGLTAADPDVQATLDSWGF